MVSSLPSNGNGEYHPKEKLVRDKIPEIIAKEKGMPPKTRIVHGVEFIQFLGRKLIEEVIELLKAPPEKRPEEFADVKTVLERLQRQWRLDLGEITKEYTWKRDRNGGFEDGIVMELEEEHPTSPEQFVASGI